MEFIIDMVKEEYVSFETAKLLKERGFDGPCHMVWYKTATDKKIVAAPQFVEGEIVATRDSVDAAARDMIYPYSFENGVEGFLAPTQAMAMRWLREEHDIVLQIDIDSYVKDIGCLGYYIVVRAKNSNREIISPLDKVFFSTYEEACDNGLQYCLKDLIDIW